MPATIRTSFAVVFFLLAAMSLAQAPDPGPYRVGGEVTRPEKISGDPPVYAEAARRARVMGVVIIEALIGEKGEVTGSRVLKGLPLGLEQAAVDAVKTWKFKPAMLRGRPVPVYYILTVNFQLDTDLRFGPLFGQFMQDNPAFAELVRGKRYDDALELLDRQPVAEVRLARTYVLLALGRVDEAWEEAQAYGGAEPYEVFYAVGSAAEDRAYEELDEVNREDLLDLGLAALTRAIETKKDDYPALSAKSRLLRKKAELADDEERQALLDEAARLEERAREVRPKPVQ
ncbi:MAG: energy transducer TonB [Thermoanaerobaculia bacterium]